MVLDPDRPEGAVTSTSFSIVAQLAGFPQVVSPVLADFMQRAHGGGCAEPDPKADVEGRAFGVRTPDTPGRPR